MAAGRWRANHGNHRRIHGRRMVFESVPDGVRAADPNCAAPIARDDAGRFTPEGARAAARRKNELAKLPDFATGELAFLPTEDFAPFDQLRRGLLTQRMTEVAEATGGVSSGVATSLRGYAWMVGFAEFYSVRAAKTGSDKDADRARHFAQSASVELAKAWELARAEGQTRPKESTADRLRREFGADK